MATKWTNSVSESGILRKNEPSEKKEELFVFGYSCKLFRDDEKALHIDQGKHLIPWMGDESLKIDRYDARGALHDLSRLEAPPGGHDWRLELTDAERRAELLCDQERYRALHCDEDEEELYREEEIKRLHAAGYGQVGFNYEAPTESTPPAPADSAEVDEPYLPSDEVRALLPADVVFPESQKLNAIIEKTAKFIAEQGTQMEILVKAKQADNSQFLFLGLESPLHTYYRALLTAIRAGKYPPAHQPLSEPEAKPEENEDYLHPSLAAPLIESAPSIPSIHYKPSADCDYMMLISKIKGTVPHEEEEYEGTLAPGELPPPGTETLTLPPPAAAHDMNEHEFNIQYYQYYEQPVAEISRAPVMYAQTDKNAEPQQSVAPALQPSAAQAGYRHDSPAPGTPPSEPVSVSAPRSNTSSPAPELVKKSAGLNLMHYYNSGSETDDSDTEDSSSSRSKPPAILEPPEDIQVIISKMASYVARNGDEFEAIVRAKNDPRFTFLAPDHAFHPFYRRLMQEDRAMNGNGVHDGEVKREVKVDVKPDKKTIAPVSFSIKKLKEPEPILPKPALPYESSSDEEKEAKDNEPKPVEPQTVQEPLPKSTQTKIPQDNLAPPMPFIPPSVIYHIDAVLEKVVPKIVADKLTPKEEVKIETPLLVVPTVQKKESKPKRRESRSKSEGRESSKQPRKSEERKVVEKKTPRREKVEVKKEKPPAKEKPEVKDEIKAEEENEVISIGDRSDDELIDLTGDLSDSRGECETDAERAKQVDRRKRAAAFLARVGADPARPASLPHNTLASAMVQTLSTMQKKRDASEERHRQRSEKRRHQHRHEQVREEELQYEAKEHAHRKCKRRKESSAPNPQSRSPASEKQQPTETEGEANESSKRKQKKEKKHKSKKHKKDREEFVAPAPESSRASSKLKESRLSPSPSIKEEKRLRRDIENRLKKKAIDMFELEEVSKSKKRGKSAEPQVDMLESNEGGKREPEFEKSRSRKEEKRRKRRKVKREYSEGEWQSSDGSTSTGSNANK